MARAMLIDACICGATAFPATLVHNGLKLEVCDCGVMHLESELSPDAYEQQYRGEYHASNERHPGCIPYVERYPHDREVAAVRLQAYQRHATRAGIVIRSALDVGAANGAFVDELVEHGINAYGIDPDPAMERPRIWNGTLKTPNPLRTIGFDLVTYHDVLEHVLDPLAELTLARKYLRGGGLLVIDVPDVSTSAGHHHFKLEHPWYFTIPALDELLRRAGYAPVVATWPIPGKLVIYALKDTAV